MEYLKNKYQINSIDFKNNVDIDQFLSVEELIQKILINSEVVEDYEFTSVTTKLVYIQEFNLFVYLENFFKYAKVYYKYYDDFIKMCRMHYLLRHRYHFMKYHVAGYKIFSELADDDFCVFSPDIEEYHEKYCYKCAQKRNDLRNKQYGWKNQICAICLGNQHIKKYRVHYFCNFCFEAINNHYELRYDLLINGHGHTKKCATMMVFEKSYCSCPAQFQRGIIDNDFEEYQDFDPPAPPLKKLTRFEKLSKSIKINFENEMFRRLNEKQ